jgi:predicted PurR-regulated permease PerM
MGRVLLIIVISVYIAKDVPKLGGAISDIAHQPGYRYDADRLMNETLLIWNAYLRGQVLLALVIGFVVAVVLSLLGVSNALALGILSGILEFLPIVGPVIGTATAVLVAVFQSGNYLGLSPLVYGLMVLGVMIVIQQVENHVLVPRIVGGALDLHPVAVMVGVLMGASLAGLVGAILAAPVLATLKLFGVYVWRKMFDLDPFPEPDLPEEQEQPRTEGRWFGIPSWFNRMGSKRR